MKQFGEMIKAKDRVVQRPNTIKFIPVVVSLLAVTRASASIEWK